MFNERYAASPTGRTPQVTRTYKGKTWYLKKGVAPAGTPGTSNHGWGLAIDVANASGKRLDWLLGDGFATSNALKFGFSWEVKDGANAEAWHIRYVCGDKLPQAVIDAVKAFPTLDAK
jgi:LAS superfamily LD-carboxypeptidase LdcB